MISLCTLVFELEMTVYDVVLSHHMMRTSVTLPKTLHQRLVMAAHYQNKKLTTFIRDLLGQALETQEQARVDRMYQDIAELKGVGPKGITDASTTIDNTLYG